MRFFFYVFFFCGVISFGHAQTDTVHTSKSSPLAPKPGPSRAESTLPQEGELNAVQFIGNSYFSNSALQDVISSLPSDLSFAHRIFRFYYRQLSINPYTPQPLEDALGVALKNYQDEYRFFDQTGAENDVLTLVDVYNQYGFHNATVSYSFDYDSTNNINLLSFSISEHHQYTIDTIVYTGLDLLPPELYTQLMAKMPIVKGTFFNEPSIKNTTEAVVTFLQNNGYYFSRYEQPTVHSSSLDYTDSVVIPIVVGKRCIVGAIDIKSDYRDQNPISGYLVRKMLDIQQGDWYNRSKVNNTQLNLYNLTVFDLVSIDTSSISPGIDADTINLQIFLQYLKQKEILLAPFINHTTYDNYTNFGVEASLHHRNLFGAAQNVSIYGRYVLQDFSLLTYPHSIAQEYQIGGIFSQPVLFEVGSAKVDLSFQSSYSYRYINSGLPSQTIPLIMTFFPLRLTFTMSFPSHTFFNSLVFEGFTELQQLHNYIEVSTDMLTNATTPKAQEDAVFFLVPFAPIYSYAADKLVHPGQIYSITLNSDTRNNPFSPTAGHFISTSTEAAIGNFYNFRRFQFTYYQFFPSGSLSTFATKIRLGNIWINLDNSYFIPFERRFFAGGANSIRSFSSRSLSDVHSSIGLVDNVNILTGNGTLIEGSFEYRFRWGRPRGISSMLADQIQQMGVTTFIDIGNVFNQLSSEKYGTARLQDFLTSLAIGFGVGFRYETPVGPFRIDFATSFYDPTTDLSKIRIPYINNLQVHIGLGHAF